MFIKDKSKAGKFFPAFLFLQQQVKIFRVMFVII
jgi:hypothetical protein